MANWIDFVSLFITLSVAASIVAGLLYVGRVTSRAAERAKESLKHKGVNVSREGVSVKTNKRWDRSDYLDATQRLSTFSPAQCPTSPKHPNGMQRNMAAETNKMTPTKRDRQSASNELIASGKLAQHIEAVTTILLSAKCALEYDLMPTVKLPVAIASKWVYDLSHGLPSSSNSYTDPTSDAASSESSSKAIPADDVIQAEGVSTPMLSVRKWANARLSRGAEPTEQVIKLKIYGYQTPATHETTKQITYVGCTPTLK
ncbi:predicted protein [Postia placenta Mad-698-R]|nr:predicted protein [Postia placenta Mad-698-R]